MTGVPTKYQNCPGKNHSSEAGTLYVTKLALTRAVEIQQNKPTIWSTT